MFSYPNRLEDHQQSYIENSGKSIEMKSLSSTAGCGSNGSAKWLIAWFVSGIPQDVWPLCAFPCSLKSQGQFQLYGEVVDSADLPNAVVDIEVAVFGGDAPTDRGLEGEHRIL